ncbi:hypothetical protein IWW55_003597 [Coemansia sp. RSA 2706]|nr:hypothetical protein IWW55_003597 [Coemansia sp. RSA 2706]KAJ2306284.1 hypothetical protein IWW54_004798 [Coemansia sp. RSA 2705]KAJ2313983.1 hypothetical protein IWW52_004408 [Coemansia sp. RSA 2704]KAJ2362513.1 hypothetical protein H4S01_004744 [Coemansia sp. RSA 2610]KAJ2381389.1 hypothetical protein H4S02_006231 [Coemansia sp. RSA 2611]
MCVANKHRVGTDDPFGVFRLYSYACNICGAIFDDVVAANDHVKESHFFPPLDF